MFDQQLKDLSDNKVIILKNKTCVYCGQEIAPKEDTEEHVVGRRFVPKGKLNGQWNLIVRAHRTCNGKKSALEDDISAITMQADAWGLYADDDPILAIEAERKGKNSMSRRTGKPVQKSAEELKLKVPFAPGVEGNFTFTSSPQIDSKRIYELAHLQLTAFFYFLTYDEETQKGGFWLGNFFSAHEAPRSDWGNPIHKAFMAAVVGWKPCFVGNSADGFFKIIIRQQHPEVACWSWGLEWNKNYRVVGFFGKEEAAQAVINSLTFSPMEAQTISQGSAGHLRFRTATQLDEENDTLFFWNKQDLKKAS